MEKVIRDNKVAVLLSDYYWYTLHGIYDLLFHPQLVYKVMASKQDEITLDLLKSILKADDIENIDLKGAKYLRIEWVLVGSVFKVVEDRGFETVEYLKTEDWIQV